MYMASAGQASLLKEDPDRREGKAKFLIPWYLPKRQCQVYQSNEVSILFPGCRVAPRGGEGAAGHNAAKMRTLAPRRDAREGREIHARKQMQK